MTTVVTHFLQKYVITVKWHTSASTLDFSKYLLKYVILQTYRCLTEFFSLAKNYNDQTYNCPRDFRFLGSWVAQLKTTWNSSNITALWYRGIQERSLIKFSWCRESPVSWSAKVISSVWTNRTILEQITKQNQRNDFCVLVNKNRHFFHPIGSPSPHVVQSKASKNSIKTEQSLIMITKERSNRSSY